MIGLVKSLCVSLFILSLSANAHARLDGVDFIELDVNGTIYEVPLYNAKVENRFYMIQKALDGDKSARKFLLGNKDSITEFVGDGERKLWLTLTRDGQHIEEVK